MNKIKFMAVDRITAAEMVMGVPYVIISIQDPENRKTYRGVAKGSYRLDLLELDFHDVDHLGHHNSINPGQQEGGLIRFDTSHATRILDFYEDFKDMANYFIVHCDAGACRSPAVCAALEKIHIDYDLFWFKRYSPNMRVYSTLIEVANERGMLNDLNIQRAKERGQL